MDGGDRKLGSDGGENVGIGCAGGAAPFETEAGTTGRNPGWSDRQGQAPRGAEANLQAHRWDNGVLSVRTRRAVLAESSRY